ERYGIRVLKTLCKVSLEPDSCVSQTQTRFERWGVNSLVIAKFIPGLAIIALLSQKFIPGLAIIAPPMAGALRIGWLRFVLLSTAAAVLWVGAYLGAGAVFNAQIEWLLGELSQFGSIAGVGLALLLGCYIA